MTEITNEALQLILLIMVQINSQFSILNSQFSILNFYCLEPRFCQDYQDLPRLLDLQNPANLINLTKIMVQTNS
jgi:hypothetical protein